MENEFKILKAGIYDSRYIFDRKDGYQTRERLIKNYEIEMFAEDGGTAFIDGKTHSMKKNSMLVCKPGQKRHSKLHFRVFYIHLDTQNEYLLDIRIDNAKNMLLFDNTSIDIIASECGFNSATYFSTVFKKKTGISPFQFRKKELNKYEL